VVRVAHVWEYTKTIIYFMQVNCVICELYLQRDVYKNQSGTPEGNTAVYICNQIIVFTLEPLTHTSKANFISPVPLSLLSLTTNSNGFIEFHPIFFLKNALNHVYDYRKSSNSQELLATSKQMSHINFKLAISNIYKLSFNSHRLCKRCSQGLTESWLHNGPTR
jgi:hypothetical protein